MLGTASSPRWPLECRGVAAIEFALVGSAFIIMMLLSLEVCYDLAVGAALDYGAHAAARFGTTGAVGLPGTNGTDRIAAMQALVIQEGGTLLSATNLQMSETSYQNVAGVNGGTGGVAGAGGSSQFVVYTFTYNQPYLVPFAAGLMGATSLIHTTSVMVLNEPF